MNSMFNAAQAAICWRKLCYCPWRMWQQAARSAMSTSAAAALRLEPRPDPVKDGGASFTLTMNSPPANTFTRAFLLQFVDTLYRLSEQSSARSLVIKSDLPTIFSGGFDLDELRGHTSREGMLEFFRLFRQAFYCLYTAPFYTVAQVSGHAPAGGCALALACDYRVMLDSERIKIGLTPTRMGITPPAWLVKLAERRLVSLHACERAVLPAQLYAPREALALGFADQLAADAGDLDRQVDSHLRQVHSADPTALGHVRSLFTRPVTDLMSDEADLNQFTDSLFSPECQGLLANARRKGA